MQRRIVRWVVEVPADPEEQKPVEWQISDIKGKFIKNFLYIYKYMIFIYKSYQTRIGLFIYSIFKSRFIS